MNVDTTPVISTAPHTRSHLALLLSLPPNLFISTSYTAYTTSRDSPSFLPSFVPPASSDSVVYFSNMPLLTSQTFYCYLPPHFPRIIIIIVLPFSLFILPTFSPSLPSFILFSLLPFYFLPSFTTVSSSSPTPPKPRPQRPLIPSLPSFLRSLLPHNKLQTSSLIPFLFVTVQTICPVPFPSSFHVSRKYSTPFPSLFSLSPSSHLPSLSPSLLPCTALNTSHLTWSLHIPYYLASSPPHSLSRITTLSISKSRNHFEKTKYCTFIHNLQCLSPFTIPSPYS